MLVTEAVILAAKLAVGIANARAAGRTTIEEADVDIALEDIEDGDADLSAAIQRAAAREAAGG